MNKVDLIMHPVRIRIITAVSGKARTPGQIAQALPDVAQATLYRQINALHEGGLLQVVAENPVRGTVEKVYALADATNMNLTAEEVANATPDDHAQYFSVFLAALMSEFTRYLASVDAPDLVNDGVGYHINHLHMTDEEFHQFGQRLSQLVLDFATPGPGRKPRSFSFALMPGTDNNDETEA